MFFRNYGLSCLLIISLVAFFGAQSLFEKLLAEFFLNLPWFMHCQQGGEVCAWKMHLGMFRGFSICFGHFWRKFWQGGHIGRSDRPLPWSDCQGGLTGLGRRSDRPWLVKNVFCLFLLHLFRGSLHLLRGSLHVFRGAPCVVWVYVLVVCSFVVSFWFLSRLCWAVALVLGDRDFVIQVIRFVRWGWCLITCLSPCSCLFFFFDYPYSCLSGVLSMHSSMGRLRTCVCPRTVCRSLVMSDWQRGVGLTLGLVLQVQVAAWFALVQVKKKCERSVSVWPPRSGEDK